MERKMKDVPEEERNKIITMVEKNPQLFQKIALEIESKMKGGKDQMSATMEVMKSHEEELRKISEQPNS